MLLNTCKVHQRKKNNNFLQVLVMQTSVPFTPVRLEEHNLNINFVR